MKPSTLLLIGVGGYVALRLAGLSKLSNKLSFAPATLFVTRKGKNVTIEFGMDIDNQSPVEATVNRTFGNVTDDKGNIIGRFSVPTYTIAASGITRIKIPIEIQFGSFLKALFMGIFKKTAIVNINYTNEVGVLSTSDTFSFDIKKQLEGIPKMLNFTKNDDVRTNPLVTNPV